MNRREVVTALAGLVTGLFPGSSQATANEDRSRNLSLIRLIASPNTFDGRKLRLAGFFEHNGLDRAVGLYVSEPDGQNAIFANSVDIQVDEAIAKKFVGRYVILEGTYHAPKGPGSEYLNGFLDHVSDVKIWGRGDNT